MGKEKERGKRRLENKKKEGEMRGETGKEERKRNLKFRNQKYINIPGLKKSKRQKREK